ncbi:MAG: hypothetical protein LBF90_03255 [Prevotellaceae bacterium]|jgi:hypothetical protein|nr:hypothetical protein [Prevotellaceae bacterium]
MTAQTLNKEVTAIARSYYRKYRRYGDLIPEYDARQLYNLTTLDMELSGAEYEPEALATVIEGNIISGAYKIDTEDNVLLYLFFAAIVIWVYYYYKAKLKK